MEPARPAVDQYVLDLLAARPLSLHDVTEARDGQCRLLPRLTSELAQTATTWARHVVPHAEMIASLLATDVGLPSPPTVLTGETRRAARPVGQVTRPPRVASGPVAGACEACGATVAVGNKRCSDCHRAANGERMQRQQAAEATQRRATGTHPSNRESVRQRIARSQRAQWESRRASVAGGGFTGRPSEFRRLILPRLAGIEGRILAGATGLSVGYCDQIREGKRVPHVRHWPALQLVGLNHEE